MPAFSPPLLRRTATAPLRPGPDSPEAHHQPPAAPSLNVVIIYDDFAAGARAVRHLASLKLGPNSPPTLWPIPWSFNLLNELPWRSRAIRDVDTADVLLLSLSRPNDMPAAIDRWITTCLHRERTQFIPVHVLFEDNDPWILSLHPAPVAAPTPVPLRSLDRPSRPPLFTPTEQPLACAVA